MTPPRGNNKRDGEPRDAKSAEKDDPEETLDDRQQAFIPDLFRRALSLGLSGIFTTEETFRRALGDTLPKDWVDFTVDQSDRTRTEFVNRLAGELARVLETMDLEAMTRSVLADHTIEVKAEIRLVADSSAKAKSGRSEKKRGRPAPSTDSDSVAGSGGKPT